MAEEHTHEHEHGHGCCCCGVHHEAVTLNEVTVEGEVNFENVMAFMQAREETVVAAREQVRSMDAKIEHLENLLKLSEDKVAALQKAVAQMRQQIKDLQAQLAAKEQ